MEGLAPAILAIGCLVFLAHLFAGLFERTRIPDVLLLTGVGVVVGPLFKVVDAEDFGMVGPVLTAVALVVILFEAGLDLDFGTLRRRWGHTAGLTLGAYGLSMAVVTAILQWWPGLPLGQALFAGAVLAGPAPSVIVPLLKQMKVRNDVMAVATLESALGEALCLLTSLAVLETLLLGDLHVGKAMGALLSSFVFAVVFGIGGGYVWSLLLRKVRTLKHGMATTPAFVFVIYGITEWLGFSGPVAALAFGVAIGNMGLVKLPWLPDDLAPESLQPNAAEKQFFGEAVFLLKTFFFVYLGISIRLNDWRSSAVALALVGALLLARFMAVRLALGAAGARPAEGALLAILVPKGLAAAVLASELVYADLGDGTTVRDIVYAAILISIILTSVLVFLQEKTAFGSFMTRLFSLPPKAGE